jgi:excisionase family DNA binding protein
VAPGARSTHDPTDWLSLGEASELLGIAPGTLRRWADDGRVVVFTTPGGHRRFSRTALRALLPKDGPRRPQLARIGAPDRIARVYRPRRRSTVQQEAWLASLPEGERLAFRERGRALVVTLLEHLDATDGRLRSVKLQEASRLAADYGRSAAANGATLSQAIAGFLEFRSPFVGELGRVSRQRGLDTRQATALLADADAALDRLLVATMTGHTLESGSTARARRARSGDR